MNTLAVNKINCGMYILTSKDGDFNNGCIINTVMQVTSQPLKIAITVNKSNYSTEIIEKTGLFNVSCIDESANFSIFENFGFHSGRDTDKFSNFSAYKKAENGIYYITEHTNAFLSAKVVDKIDVGTHIMFIAEVTDADVLSEIPSASYSYYHTNIKPKPKKQENSDKVRWVCKICGYIYEGDELPEDFICPICGHPASDFEKM